MPDVPGNVQRDDALAKVIEQVSREIAPCLVAEIMFRSRALTTQNFAGYLSQAIRKAWFEFQPEIGPFNLTFEKFNHRVLERIAWVMSETAKYKDLRIIVPKKQ